MNCLWSTLTVHIVFEFRAQNNLRQTAIFISYGSYMFSGLGQRFIAQFLLNILVLKEALIVK